jgi:GPI ethanolamine phosphate transferase 1
MFAVGVLYLLFEKSILVDAESSKDPLSSPSVDVVSRIILGCQVCSCSPLSVRMIGS